MKIILSKEAAQEIRDRSVHVPKDYVASIVYVFQPPQIEEHYHRIAGDVSVSFTQDGKQVKNKGHWALGWDKREKIPDEGIQQVNDISIVLTPWNSAPSSTEALVTYSNNEFNVIYK